MELTLLQEKFAQGVAVEGLDQHAAYVAAGYSANMLPSTIDEAASRLAADSKVKARIIELKAALTTELVANHAWNLSELLTEYQINALGARKDKQWAASNGALTGYGKASGLVVEKLTVAVEPSNLASLNPEEIRTMIEQRERMLSLMEAGATVDTEMEAGTTVDTEPVVEGEVIDRAQEP